jgi:hypothetical protein
MSDVHPLTIVNSELISSAKKLYLQQQNKIKHIETIQNHLNNNTFPSNLNYIKPPRIQHCKLTNDIDIDSYNTVMNDLFEKTKTQCLRNELNINQLTLEKINNELLTFTNQELLRNKIRNDYSDITQYNNNEIATKNLINRFMSDWIMFTRDQQTKHNNQLDKQRKKQEAKEIKEAEINNTTNKELLLSIQALNDRLSKMELNNSRPAPAQRRGREPHRANGQGYGGQRPHQKQPQSHGHQTHYHQQKRDGDAHAYANRNNHHHRNRSRSKRRSRSSSSKRSFRT